MVLPPDPGIPKLNRLFEAGWMWKVYRELYGDTQIEPDSIRAHRFTYRPGKRAIVGYVAERTFEDWVVEDEFACEVIVGQEGAGLFRYPRDPYLPGLAVAASPVEAQALLSAYVALHPGRLRLYVVRYRPSTRAVLRYTATWHMRGQDSVQLFVRAMRPEMMPRFLQAGKLAHQSMFTVPSLAGHWEEGGIVWLGALPGQTVRELITLGRAPDPSMILDYLASIWSLEAPKPAMVTSLPKSLSWTAGFLSHLLQGRDGQEAVATIRSALEPLADSWQPSGTAHNDFYDDQMIVLPSGELALADFEECGLGDQMVDVANFLAQLHWSSHFGRRPQATDYRKRLRSAALQRFGWAEEELNLREAYCLLRLCTNPVRSLRPEWAELTERGLELAASVLDRGLRAAAA